MSFGYKLWHALTSGGLLLSAWYRCDTFSFFLLWVSLILFFYVGGPALATPCPHRWALSYACKMLNAMSGAENVLKSYSAYRITEFSNGRILKCMSTTYQHDTNPPPLSPHPPPCMCVSLLESEYIYICFAFCCVFLPCKWKGEWRVVH